MANIKKIKLLDGSVYSIFDEGAFRIDETTGKLITGNGIVDKVILDGDLCITEIDDVPVNQAIYNVLVWDTVTYQVKKRSVDKLLEDIGGASYNMNDGTGTLSLKIGKQNNN